MLHTLKWYLKVYGGFVSNCVALNSGFRTHFFLLIAMDIVLIMTKIFGVSFVYDHITTIGPWDKNQLLFFLTYALCVRNLHMIFVFESFWKMGLNIRTGQFDYMLLRPLHSIFNCFFYYFRPSAIFITPIIFGIMINYGIKVGLTPIDWLLLPAMIALSFVLVLIIEFTLSVSIFWLTEGTGINLVRIQFQELSRWPDFVYSGGVRGLMITVIPILLTSSAPVRFLYDSKDYLPLLGALVATVVGYKILLKLWQIGVNRYESASS